MTYKHPKGFVINDADYGSIFIGEDDKVDRTRQIEIHSASDACIKLFKDGGFEIQSQATSDTADNILSQSPHGLNIKSTGDGIHLDAGNGEITLKARSIRFESSGSDQNFVIRSKANIDIDATDTLRLTGSVVAAGARTRMLLRSPGPIYINSDTGVSIVEPKISLCPANLLSFVQTLATNVFGF